MIRPPHLKKGGKIAVISPSWNGTSAFPQRFNQAQKQAQKQLGIHLVLPPIKPKTPKKKVEQLLWAVENPSIDGIFSSIGGQTAATMIPHIDESVLDIIRKNPKWFVGFSDTTVINYIFTKAGLASAYGPTALFGLAENQGMPNLTKESLYNALFTDKEYSLVQNKEGWTADLVPWTEEGNKVKRKMYYSQEKKFYNGKKVEGELIGGCLEVLVMLSGTPIWPSKSVWKDKILFIETSEEAPSPSQMQYWLRGFGAQGILNDIRGILFGIPGYEVKHKDKKHDEKIINHVESFEEYEHKILEVLEEFNADIPLVSRLHIGHIMPMHTVCFGDKAYIYPDRNRVHIRDERHSP